MVTKKLPGKNSIAALHRTVGNHILLLYYTISAPSTFSSILHVLVKFWRSVFTQNSGSGNAPTLDLNKKPPNYRQTSYS